jgi:hypothetical protein
MMTGNEVEVRRVFARESIYLLNRTVPKTGLLENGFGSTIYNLQK